MVRKKSSENDSSFLELQSKTARILLKIGGTLFSFGILSFVALYWNQLSLDTHTGVLTVGMALFYSAGTYTIQDLEKKTAGSILIALGFLCYGVALFFAEKSITFELNWSETEWESILFFWALGGLCIILLTRKTILLTAAQKLLLIILLKSLLIFGIASNHLSYKSWTDFPKKDLYTSKDAQESVLEEIASDIVKD